LRDFADALGPRGIAEVAAMVETRAAAARSGSWSDFAVPDFREQLAELSGDVDHYVAVLSQRPYQHQRIATALRDAGRPDEAIAWARKGLDSMDAAKLLDLMVGILQSTDRHDEAIQVRRDEFERHPTVAAYRKLADLRADDDWALTVLTVRVSADSRYAGELIELLLVLGHTDDAWQRAQDHRSEVGATLWLRLLERRATTHAIEVIPHYADLIEQHVLNSSDKQRYRRAVGLLPALRDAYLSAGRPDEFPAYLVDLRARHTIRPTLRKTLDAAGF
jgi:tetratricopeptide (TPR) repeat protein